MVEGREREVVVGETWYEMGLSKECCQVRRPCSSAPRSGLGGFLSAGFGELKCVKLHDIH